MATEWVIARLGEAERAAWVSVVESVGWRLDPAEIDLLFAAGGAWGAYVDGHLAGVASVYRYGQRLAWLGNVAVLPDVQRRGIGSKLIDHVLRQFEGAAGAVPVGLVARKELAPLYARFGFRPVGEVVRLGTNRVLVHHLPQEPLGVEGQGDAWLEDVRRLDEHAFGADRSELLQRVMRAADKVIAVCDDAGKAQGMGVALPSETGMRVGPILAQNDIMALNLMHLLAEGVEGPVVMDVPAERASFLHRLRKLGFEDQSSSVIMLRGAPRLPGHRQYLYALMRPAFG
ncbi:GNAT family N-acetyltransferase [Alicyclobacillus acidocaldarius]|uniref:GCN5-related N-acetyltransferase n=1 Tax=Alicyclobacillus acidocaldarius (strain Tc-4-1) TaxID=1048834 RepID=F8IEU7_ALIAT|nr:GNAT family N-acetyltransferase [Alicyclobacillus acidocaldarius]AEJ43993.1 GCN5-related N-acetyltransferase [Alicyclobacillus acidocaldarius subsp. acidocaldarius Tc-4-1]